MKKEFFRWWLFVCLIVTATYFGVSAGLFDTMFSNDVTYLSSVIISIFGITTALTGWRTWLFNYREEYTDTKMGWFVGEVMFGLGMIGTLIGFLLVFGDSLANLDLQNETSKVMVIAEMGVGIATAIWTTLCGLVCTVLLWIQLVNLEYGIDHYGEE